MSAIHALEIPKWGMTMNEGTITEWLVAEGAEVQQGTPLAVVESSKISGELEAPAAGVLRRRVGTQGQTYPVGAVVAVVAEASVAEEEIDAFLGGSGNAAAGDSTAGDVEGGDSAGGDAGGGADSSGAARKKADRSQNARQDRSQDPPARTPSREEKEQGVARTPAPAADAAATSENEVGPETEIGQDSIPEELRGTAAEEVPATPHAARLAEEHGIDLSAVEPTGRGGRVTVRDLQDAVEHAGGRLSFGSDRPKVLRLPEIRDDAEVPATPVARRLAQEHGINLHSARPTGRAGRVTRADVLALVAREEAAEDRSDRASAAPEQPAPAPAAEANPSQRTPMSRMRRVIGARLQESYQQSPHFRVSGRARIDRLLQVRKEINDHRLDVKVSVNDVVTKAVATALVRVPALNVQYDPDEQVITSFAHADIAVAVATQEGLITPILRGADRLSLTELSRELADLATRAKAGTLAPDEFQGGTFTVSNLGMFGVSSFDAIINPPQAAILAVAAAEKTLVPGQDGAAEAATVLPFTVSADHRVVDGALAARFVQELTTLLETPSLIFG